jgi:hypothetical protein
VGGLQLAVGDLQLAVGGLQLAVTNTLSGIGGKNTVVRKAKGTFTNANLLARATSYNKVIKSDFGRKGASTNEIVL